MSATIDQDLRSFPGRWSADLASASTQQVVTQKYRCRATLRKKSSLNNGIPRWLGVHWGLGICLVQTSVESVTDSRDRHEEWMPSNIINSPSSINLIFTDNKN